MEIMEFKTFPPRFIGSYFFLIFFFFFHFFLKPAYSSPLETTSGVVRVVQGN